ncbi:MAG: response regulator [Chloroflexaceae bacterium]|nr:response regulator [Chloroflexaceae bacterium]
MTERTIQSVEPHQASVVVVEDNADNLFIIVDMLREDVRVKYCNARASGRQLFKLLETQAILPVDLILLDIQIPYEDGYAVLRQIRETPALLQTKVVAVTANVLPQDVQRAREEGFDGFIGKPLNADRFPEQILRILGGESVWEPR